MKRLILALLSWFACLTVAHAQPVVIPCYPPAANPANPCIALKNFNALGYQQITSLSSAVTLTVPANATIAEICVETQGIRYRDDGTAPTASIGMPVASGTCFQYAGPLSAIQIIQQTSSATIDISYYK
jgi:hypothetical protein